MPIDTALAKIIADQILEGGPVSFRDFMDFALYHPEHGYYCRPDVEIGKAGDFYTSPHVSPIFGWTIARAFEKLWEADDLLSAAPRSRAKREPLVVVEFGAGRGFLARDALEYFQLQNPAAADRLQYVVVDSSPAMRQAQANLFSEASELRKRIRWASSEDLDGFSGIVVAHEFVDALPFHRVVRKEDRFEEIFVDVRDGEFVEALAPLSSERLGETAQRLAAAFTAKTSTPWPQGQELEVSLETADWLSNLAQTMSRGWIIIIDYGDPVEKLFASPRPQGTVKAFFHHQISDRLYEHVGRQDITADVNFTLLNDVARDLNFSNVQLLTQADFLQRNELLEIVEARSRALHLSEEAARNARRQILNLILPEMMGARFKIFIAKK